MRKKMNRKPSLKLNIETVRDLHRVGGGYANLPPKWQTPTDTVDMEGCCCTQLCGTTNFTCER